MSQISFLEAVLHSYQSARANKHYINTAVSKYLMVFTNYYHSIPVTARESYTYHTYHILSLLGAPTKLCFNISYHILSLLGAPTKLCFNVSYHMLSLLGALRSTSHIKFSEGNKCM